MLHATRLDMEEGEEEEEEGGGSVETAAAVSYRQRLEKSLEKEMVLMEWSPTMDLLAATLADKSVKQMSLELS